MAQSPLPPPPLPLRSALLPLAACHWLPAINLEHRAAAKQPSRAA
jgi:hypothetical protein